MLCVCVSLKMNEFSSRTRIRGAVLLETSAQQASLCRGRILCLSDRYDEI